MQHAGTSPVRTGAPVGTHRFDVASAVEVIREHARLDPDGIALTFLASGDDETDRISRAELEHRTQCLAAQLQRRLPPGSRVLLMLPSGIDYVVGLLGCLYARMVAVPVYPPTSGMHAQRMARIVGDCGARCVLALARQCEALQGWIGCHAVGAEALEWVAVDAAGGPAAAWVPPRLGREDIAFLQYTSGSTGDPRGVKVSHGNLLSHAASLQAAHRQHAGDVFVSWLPLFHDMGLIGMVLQPLMLGARVVLMPPAAFLQRPVRWLRAVSRYRGTVSYAPDFAFGLCAALPHEAGADPLDLSCWRVAVDSAEPLHAQAIDAFFSRWQSSGLARQTPATAYGLAEATLMVSASPSPPHGGVRVLRACACALRQGRIERASDGTAATMLVSSGRVVPCLEARIVHPERRTPCVAGEVGELWLRGPTVAQGYWQDSGSGGDTFGAMLGDGSGPWLRTGDLGGLHEGELYIVGRCKDLIIVRGENHHPSDLEHTAQRAHPALAVGRAAAFGVEVAFGEGVVLAMEVRRTSRRHVEGKEVLARVRAALKEQHGLALHALVLLRPGKLPITSSGKVQRQACRQRFVEGSLDGLFEWREHAQVLPATDAPSEPGPLGDFQQLLDLLLACCANALRLDAARMAELAVGFADRRLNMIGVESLGAIELAHRLHAALQIDVPLELLLGGQTAGDVVRHLQVAMRLRELRAGALAAAQRRQGEFEVWTL